jgi:hypothetical protein
MNFLFTLKRSKDIYTKTIFDRGVKEKRGIANG